MLTTAYIIITIIISIIVVIIPATGLSGGPFRSSGCLADIFNEKLQLGSKDGRKSGFTFFRGGKYSHVCTELGPLGLPPLSRQPKTGYGRGVSEMSTGLVTRECPNVLAG